MINAARLKDEFLELVSISSPSKREGTIARRLETILKTMGASVEVDGAGPARILERWGPGRD